MTKRAISIIHLNADTNHYEQDTVTVRSGESVKTGLKHSRFNIDFYKHALFGTGIRKIDGQEEGKATKENEEKYGQDKDPNVPNMAGKEGQGFMVIAVTENGAVGKSAHKDENGDLTWDGIDQTIEDGVIAVIVVSNASGHSDLPKNIKELMKSGIPFLQLQGSGVVVQLNLNAVFSPDTVSYIFLIAQIAANVSAYINSKALSIPSLEFLNSTPRQNLQHSSVFASPQQISFSSALELSRRQLLFAQSEARRQSQMLFFDAAATDTPESFNQDSAQSGMPQSHYYFFPAAPFGFDGGFASGGERMRSGAKSPNRQLGAISIPNPNTARTSVKTGIANTARTHAPASKKIAAKTGARIKAANSQRAHAGVANEIAPNARNATSNFLSHAPLGEGKTQNPLHTPQPNINMRTNAAHKNTQVSLHNANVQARIAQAHAAWAAHQQAIAQPSQQTHAAQQAQAAQPATVQTEQQEALAQAQHLQHSNVRIENTSIGNADVGNAQIESAQTTAVQIAIKNEKAKASKAKIVALVPIIISANGDDGKNKTAADPNEAEPAQTIRLSPRRIIPISVAFFPLRIFENNGNKRKKEGRKAA